VKPGQSVRTAEVLGQSGDTGLAGGDHLHFSIAVWGTHVDPVEWWDPHWMRDHVTSKLEMFPPAGGAATDEGAEPAPQDGAAEAAATNEAAGTTRTVEGNGEARP
jgi:murein DD-endopeptidase MepM/ murein hydrolase activator NlpD